MIKAIVTLATCVMLLIPTLSALRLLPPASNIPSL
ncbi:hypothetical protein [Enterobacter phage 04_vB_Eclo_IJM]|nr:hypothetical protein [Enterobacter phage 04_vB_Eclo_IJM]